MIGYLCGPVLSVDNGELVILIGQLESGVGYRVQVESKLAERTNVGDTIRLHTLLESVQDSPPTLVGFPSADALTLFGLLTRTSGIGRAVALALLDQHGVGALCQALVHEDHGTLQATKGVGNKTARRLILDLHTHSSVITLQHTHDPHHNPPPRTQRITETIAALKQLGLRHEQAQELVKTYQDREDLNDTPSLLKVCLAHLKQTHQG